MDSLPSKTESFYNLSANHRRDMDWWLFGATLPILAAGLMTMFSFTGNNAFASHQFIWIMIGMAFFFGVSFIDVRFLRSTWVSVSAFVVSALLLGGLFAFGTITNGSRSWFDLGSFSFQPSDLAKLVVIVILAKYFSRRHIEIANVRHILVSGLYAFVLFALVLGSPDLGSAMIIFFIWLGMVMVSGISKKHLFAMIGVSLLIFGLLWSFGFKEYQKDRIRSFIDPLADIHGAGYNAYQSTIAVGSGQIWGKGLGYGTQSRLKFLPEYQTDFIFAAFAEEWGFVGVLILFSLYGVIIWRIVKNSLNGATNFEILFGAGVAVFFIVHIVINVGMNVHLLPVTGTPLPFMSYGGTHILTEFLALGVVVAMRRYSRPAHKDAVKNEFIGPQ
ncbi:MAG: rod shape-determining protein RodA [Candidatus Taylorbacteria bacterium RIFCSPHIGHO2_01_FULL_44_110]|uniref:Rod shape-determining protein RodA n=1 Tax=Candidatus Taylorbacteria bacterium RIFCSPHIGHO2_12_FULL_45_16 TaxID=1802315 RepID=A0A1G2N0D6_9BACT|nr:MAG: rod shape-determining protein RodA [Candidatus Taylorbacteria bacterium RIFCSPHIGHO2_01_FULL_44_110]OHA28782.1 MAG: rod shape-determining protein RodA [Candidatus Taylorbacteria bacterium RIFCSPHIGHO2_12_FULL_45_16]OHA32841.1 MAG: rod shape-determining protein RodA [Candidatus Taylorbacteria bacterium RIFCSPLOWO2_01_FULL_45_59]OHA38235.1 MAG: rod shape-determining protein RodA [Candidatus Taylorbacteria bacterium RIFCSPLOWO2_02_FULL_45_10b]OHA43952.1 MAG: rod shape-determining protein R